ncbi:unnamed protein product [Fusarium graminearum]|nr:unnamed protein product [Fusarium graminearum]CAG1963435.1 unnamed protein product [Fusarium graminearum]VTO84910.1 unnamed protein product [Fusarium graminearum]
MAMFAEHGVVVARRHCEKKSRKCTIPSPRSESAKGEWSIGAKVPTKVDGCLQRSASAPAESRRRQQGATVVLRVN